MRRPVLVIDGFLGYFSSFLWEAIDIYLCCTALNELALGEILLYFNGRKWGKYNTCCWINDDMHFSGSCNMCVFHFIQSVLMGFRSFFRGSHQWSIPGKSHLAHVKFLHCSGDRRRPNPLSSKLRWGNFHWQAQFRRFLCVSPLLISLDCSFLIYTVYVGSFIRRSETSKNIAISSIVNFGCFINRLGFVCWRFNWSREVQSLSHPRFSLKPRGIWICSLG